ncbi:MAG: hypothetical protein ACPK7O_00615 [Methanobacterium sp.]
MSTRKKINKTYHNLSLFQAYHCKLADTRSKWLIKMGGENVEEDWPIRADNPERDSAGIYPSFKKVFKTSPGSINHNW